ncbi:1-hydroxycarotenoid 3,4-desaturase CrtD [Polymorphobacter sp.]|uniref:1-hydroxycarotenoid 3,4-desaturase CrtD n=1 Tax=Polymorphobacter sp. TaxID=1909290 RepID=UPI003F728E8D
MPVVIVGAGMGGLSAAAWLAGAGVPVVVVERMHHPGGKLRTVDCGGVAVDAGPTVFTGRDLFEAMFDQVGEQLADHLTLTSAERLARHGWQDGTQLDLWRDPGRSREAVAAFAGASEAAGWDAFQAESKRIWDALEHRFMAAPATSPVGLAARFGLSGMPEMLAINPFQTLRKALGRHFRDPRLIQLYGRYATYCGASPYEATATLMLIAHLEARGVWLVEGGMHRLAEAVAALANRHGARFHYGTEVQEICVTGGRASGVRLASGEVIEAADVIANCDVSALADGRFGPAVAGAAAGTPPADRSLSGFVLMMTGEANGFALDRHNVFFSDDYAREFREIFAQKRLPSHPSVYVCAQDRGESAPSGPIERFQLIINAPATGDGRSPTSEEMDACRTASFEGLRRCGLTLRPKDLVQVDPKMFEALFPSTGGALYGRVSHGWRASFRRPGSASRIPGLWLAGGSAHPGAGVPMAALSGRLASDAILKARGSTRTFRPMAIAGGTSTPKAIAGASA